MEIRISVRSFVEFLLRSGDIDNRRKAVTEDAMQEGSRIHRMIQKSMGEGYQAEVPLFFVQEAGKYQIVISGRADGIFYDKETYVIDEIKGTYRELSYITEPNQVHLAQAKCYAYFWAKDHARSTIDVQLTYCNMDTELIKRFRETYQFLELEEWFLSLVAEYKKWSDFEFEWKQKRTASIRALAFPYAYREGQKELAGYVYATHKQKRKLFIQAPTGVGKTLSTVFPTVKAIGEGMGDKLFYLTAKTITRTVAKDTFSLLREKGLLFKTVILTAKEKICFANECNCNPTLCPYAQGHYDRINGAIYELLICEDDLSREVIEAQARKHRVCPFELGLDMSLFCDGVIGDYNYLFDPYAYLRRFFAEGVQGAYFFLVDEAHNLVERGRQMYSAQLVKEDFLALKKIVKPYNQKIERLLERCNKELLAMKKQCENVLVNPSTGSFTMALTRLHSAMNEYLEEHEDSPVHEEVLGFYFEISRFLEVYEKLDEHYLTYAEHLSDGSFVLKEFCVNPANRLKECMERGISTVLFSATFLPIQYYKGLLGGSQEDYEVYANSTFDASKRALLIGRDVTTKYTRRNAAQYDNIARYIKEITAQKAGNYMVFFPSYQFLTNVYEAFTALYYDEKTMECVLQSEHMDEEMREAFLAKFTGEALTDETAFREACAQINMEIAPEECDDKEPVRKETLIGFCVMGGIFGEGIDLKNDSLIGAIIVGTGIPQVCNERELVKVYFDEMGENGFDYSYRYPGMNKVLQAAGRVIRTAEDVGVIALLDERFLQSAYQRMFPREWQKRTTVTLQSCDVALQSFWEMH